MIIQESIDLCRRGGQSGDVQRDAADQLFTRSFGRWLQFIVLDVFKNERIYRVANPSLVGNVWNGLPLGRNEGPVLLPFCAFTNPRFERLNLTVR